jgi:NitT/TauT family transport system permease protein
MSSAPAMRARPARLLRAVSAAAPMLVLGLVVVLAWEVVVRLGIVTTYVLPSPSAIATAFMDDLPVLARATGTTAFCVLFGMLLGAAIAIVFSLLVSLNEIVGSASLIVVAILSSAPIMALAPIFNVWFGTVNLFSKIAVAALVVYFPVAINLIRGLSRVDPVHRELMASVSASRAQMLWLVRVPSAVPAGFTGLRIAAPLSVIGVIASEFFGGSSDALGVYITHAAALQKFAETWAGVVIASALGLVVFGAVALIERVVTPRRTSAAP